MPGHLKILTIPNIPGSGTMPTVKTHACDALVFNASYLRCKNIQLGYTLPSHISEKFFVENLKIYTSIDNLFTLTDFPGLDPEIAAGVGYPQLRQYSVGINVTF